MIDPAITPISDSAHLSQVSLVDPQAVMKRWLPLSESVLRMVVERGPSPADAQVSRVKVLWPTIEEAVREGGDEGTFREGEGDVGGDNARIM